MARWAAAWAACVAVGLGIACGGSTAGGGAENPSMVGGSTEVTVSVVPAAATLHPGGSQQFSATVTHAADASVDWSIAEGSSGGAIDAKGLFTAGVTPGTFHVTARSRADPTKSAMATVVIPTPPIPTLIAVAVSPRNTTVEVGHATRFVATVTGTLDTDVVWSVVEGSAGGTIDASGSYTAPATTGTFHVAAASHADPSKTDSAEVTVVATPPPPSSVQVTISPTAVRLPTGASASFTAEVRNSADKDGTWSVAEGDAGGTITKAGVYTAPATAGVYHVVITAHADPTATARAEVTVLAPSPPAPQSNVVTISPQSEMMMARIPTQLDAWAFTATAPGSGQVDYSIVEGDAGGMFGSGGVYSPPYTPGTYHVVATSRDNPSLSATATVIVRPRGGTIVPSSASVAPGGTVELRTSRPPDEFVSWSIEEGSAGGSVDFEGVYVAPQQAGTYHVYASGFDGMRIDTAVVTVRPDPVYVTLNMPPRLTGMHPGDRAAYRAEVHGSSDQRVTWSIVEGAAGSTIGTDGMYASPRDRAGTFHIVATSVAAPSATAVAVFQTCVGNGCGQRFYDLGGPVLPTSVTYALFWGDPAAFPADARAGIESLLQGLEGSGHLGLADQYMRGARATTRFAGTIEDRSTPPEGGVSVAIEICRILDENGVAPRADAIYFLFTSSGLIANFCAWHSISTCHGVPIQIAYMPNPDKSTCVWQTDLGCSKASAATRAWQSFTAHEFFETITDRTGPSAWVGVAGEIGDACTGYQACVPLSNGQTFQIQAEYSNAANACAIR